MSTFVMIGLVSMIWNPAYAFTTYDCMNQSNIVETCSLLEPDLSSASDENGDVETTMYGGACLDEAW
jgi:hypothetical protein